MYDLNPIVTDAEIRRVISAFYDRTWKNQNPIKPAIRFVHAWLVDNEDEYDQILIAPSPEIRYRYLAFAVVSALDDYEVGLDCYNEEEGLDYLDSPL